MRQSALGKVIGLCHLIWLLIETVSWLSDYVTRFVEAYGAYLIATALGLLVVFVSRL